MREAKNPDFAQAALDDANLTPDNLAAIGRIAQIGLGLHLGLVLLPFAGARRAQLAHPPPPAADAQRTRAGAPWPCCPAPACWRRCGNTKFRMPRCAAGARAAPPAASW